MTCKNFKVDKSHAENKNSHRLMATNFYKINLTRQVVRPRFRGRVLRLRRRNIVFRRISDHEAEGDRKTETVSDGEESLRAHKLVAAIMADIPKFMVQDFSVLKLVGRVDKH